MLGLHAAEKKAEPAQPAALSCVITQRGMAMSRGSTGDIILQGGRKLDLRDRSLSTQDVTALADLLSTRKTEVSTLILYNVRLNSDVSALSKVESVREIEKNSIVRYALSVFVSM